MDGKVKIMPMMLWPDTILSYCQLFLVLMLLPAVSGCSPSHILNRHTGLSRDYTYIDFERNNEPFTATESVGGKHIKHLKIIGFEGNKFLVEFMNIAGTVMFDVSGTGLDYRKITPLSGTIFIRDLDTIVSIETWAHPAAEYTITVTKL